METLRTRTRGASTVEYALLLAVMLIGGAASFRALGHSMARATADGTDALGSASHEIRVIHLPKP